MTYSEEGQTSAELQLTCITCILPHDQLTLGVMTGYVLWGAVPLWHEEILNGSATICQNRPVRRAAISVE